MTLQEACPLLWSDAEIVKFCSNVRVNTDAAVGVVDIGGGHSCVRVVRLGREVCVKFGLGVSKEEAENQTEAYALLSPHIVRVPRVFRFFSNVAPGDYTRGYLIMEYIEGDTLLLDDLAHIDRVASMLARFSETQSHMPGPLHRGGAQGPVWSDYEKPCFRNTDNLECWLNRRLQASDPRLALKDFPLVLCHLDIAPRNILWQQDGTPCLIDWASAGFYPRFFETCILMISDGMNGDFEPMLLESMESLTSVETSQLRSLMQSYGNGMRFYFPPRLLESRGSASPETEPGEEEVEMEGMGETFGPVHNTFQLPIHLPKDGAGQHLDPITGTALLTYQPYDTPKPEELLGPTMEPS